MARSVRTSGISSRSGPGSAGRCGNWTRPTPTPTSGGFYGARPRERGCRGRRLFKTYFLFLELRHKVEIHALTGRVVQCPIDELNRPRGQTGAALRIPPSDAQVRCLFAGWRGELATCRKYAPTARNYAAARLMAEVGLRVNEARNLDLAAASCTSATARAHAVPGRGSGWCR